MKRSAGSDRPLVLTKPKAALVAGWREGLSILNLRGDPKDEAFARAAAHVLGVRLPTEPGATSESTTWRVVWVGPDDWFVTGSQGEAVTLLTGLREAFVGQHHAVTDVSSGYTVLQLEGPSARDVLAQGCPLDLHPRVFAPGCCAGSHFFKAAIWLWQVEANPTYQLLVRRSFMDYVWLMLERASQECGLEVRKFA